MLLKELALFTINFFIGLAVVYFGMITMKIIHEIDPAVFLQQVIVYVLFTAIGINYVRIFLANRLA